MPMLDLYEDLRFFIPDDFVRDILKERAGDLNKNSAGAGTQESSMFGVLSLDAL
jgi:hypothetical protein